MSWNEKHTKLREVLSTLFPKLRESEIVVRDAELDIRLIEWNNSARLNWQSIIEIAIKQEMIPSLVQSALNQFPNNTALEQACREWGVSESEIIEIKNSKVVKEPIEEAKNGNPLVSAFVLLVSGWFILAIFQSRGFNLQMVFSDYSYMVYISLILIICVLMLYRNHKRISNAAFFFGCTTLLIFELFFYILLGYRLSQGLGFYDIINIGLVVKPVEVIVVAAAARGANRKS